MTQGNQWTVADAKDTTIKIENGSYSVLTRVPVKCPFKVNLQENFEIEFDFKIVPSPENRGLSFFYWGNFLTNKGVNAIIYFDNKGNSLRFPQFNVIPINIYTANISSVEYNKFTIRKIENRYYYYLNERPFYYFDEVNLDTNTPLWFGCLASMQFDNVTYSSILK